MPASWTPGQSPCRGRLGRALFVDVETEGQPSAETELRSLLRTVEARTLNVPEQPLKRRCPVKRTGARHLHGLFHDTDCRAANQRATSPDPVRRLKSGLAGGG